MGNLIDAPYYPICILPKTDVLAPSSFKPDVVCPEAYGERCVLYFIIIFPVKHHLLRSTRSLGGITLASFLLLCCVSPVQSMGTVTGTSSSCWFSISSVDNSPDRRLRALSMMPEFIIYWYKSLYRCPERSSYVASVSNAAGGTGRSTRIRTWSRFGSYAKKTFLGEDGSTSTSMHSLMMLILRLVGSRRLGIGDSGNRIDIPNTASNGHVYLKAKECKTFRSQGFVQITVGLVEYK